MKRVRITALTLLVLSACAGNSTRELTYPEQATAACHKQEIRDEFSNGHTDYCFVIMLDEITSAHDVEFIHYEDGSAWLQDDGTGKGVSYQENTFPWDCNTMGNKVCGS